MQQSDKADAIQSEYCSQRRQGRRIHDSFAEFRIRRPFQRQPVRLNEPLPETHDARKKVINRNRTSIKAPQYVLLAGGDFSISKPSIRHP